MSSNIVRTISTSCGRTITISHVTDVTLLPEERQRIRGLRPLHMLEQLEAEGFPPETDVCFYCPRYHDDRECLFGTADWSLLMDHFNSHPKHFVSGHDTIQWGQIKSVAEVAQFRRDLDAAGDAPVPEPEPQAVVTPISVPGPQAAVAPVSVPGPHSAVAPGSVQGPADPDAQA